MVTVATARELISYADEAALSADSAARFVGARMIETDDPDRFIAQYTLDNPAAAAVDPETADSSRIDDAVILKLMDQARGDLNVGDGHAETSAFYYELATGLLAIVVRADGSIAYGRVVPASGKGTSALEWSIDSKDASDLFASANTAFAQLRGTSHVMVWDLVNSDSENAYWQGGMLRASPTGSADGDPHLNGTAADYCELADFKIDAVTGKILSHGALHTPTSGKLGASQCDG